MSIFGKIKDAIFGKAKAQEAPRSAPSGSGTPAAQGRPSPSPLPSANARPQQVSEVDVEQRLDSLPGADKLNWRTSIVDLMKLVGLDASYEERKELAHELGDADYSGKAEENIWLHRQVMGKLAANGGRVPADLRD